MKKEIGPFPGSPATMFINYLWTDKKRYLGLPLSFTRYSLSEDRLFEDRGLLIARHNEILLYRVKDINVSISLWQRLFGVGTIKIYSVDSSSPVLCVMNVKEALAVKELIHLTVEKVKEEKGVMFGEYFGPSL